MVNLARTGLFSLPRLSDGAKHLRELNIAGNKIYELYPNEFEGMSSLRTLDMADNRLLDLKASLFERLPQLRHLNLSGNDVRILQREHLEALMHVETLRLGRMHSLARLPEPDAFAHLKSLRELHVRALNAYFIKIRFILLNE